MRMTIFTPTFNRGYIINNLYSSLARQSFKDFEWVICDDGSNDNTKNLVDNYILKSSFQIRYILSGYVKGGKSRAINRGLDIAKGELFIIVDSDDYLTDDALSIIDKIEKSIGNDEKLKYAGVCGDRGYDKSHGIGSFNVAKGEFLDSTFLDRDKKGICGDKCEAFYTDVLRRYKFPEFEGESFMPEGIVFNRMSMDGLLFRHFNEIICVCNYLDDGLTKSMKEKFLSSPKGYGLYVYELVNYQISKKKNVYMSYYNLYRKSLSIKQMSNYLNENSFVFVFISFFFGIPYAIKKLFCRLFCL